MGDMKPTFRQTDIMGFSGAIASYPVELFLSVVENETAVCSKPQDNMLWNESQENMCKNAWDLISDDRKSPAGIWKSKMVNKYGHGNSIVTKWSDMKQDLLDAFGRLPETPYTFEEKFNFLASLIKGEQETFTSFVCRVKWVLSCPLEMDSEGPMAKMVFLLGLSDTHQQAHFLNKICSESKSLVDIVQEASESKTDLVPKEEELMDIVFDDELGHLSDVDFHQPVKEKEDDMFFKNEETPSEAGGMAEEPPSDSEMPLSKLKKKKRSMPKKVPKTSEEKRRIGDNFKGKKDSYPCTICGVVKLRPCELAIHMKRHKEIRGCFTCGIKDVVMSPEEWDKHEAEFHLGKCQLCCLSFDDLKTMRNHHESNHKGNNARCKSCRHVLKLTQVDHICRPCHMRKIEAVEKNSKLDKDLLKKRKKKIDYTFENYRYYTCKEGEDPLKVRSFMTYVVKLDKDGVATYYCSYCRLDFKTAGLLTKHSKTAHEFKKYRCDICPDSDAMRWKALDRLAYHKHKYHNILLDGYNEMSCDKCEYKCLFPYLLRLHERETHPAGGEEASTCNICNKKFKSVTYVRKHKEIIHMRLERFECDQCPRKFCLSRQLIDHKMDSHGPNGPLPKDHKAEVCPICGAKIKNHYALKAHMTMQHTLPKVKCPKCDREFNNKYQLKAHDRVSHTRTTKYYCPECPDAVFYRREVQNDHCMYHHIKIKPYVCTTCGTAFWQKIVMGRHIALNHEKWPQDKANKEWKFLLRENPGLFKQIPIKALIKQFLGEPSKKEYLT